MSEKNPSRGKVSIEIQFKMDEMQPTALLRSSDTMFADWTFLRNKTNTVVKTKQETEMCIT